jgi:hypothetical protein
MNYIVSLYIICILSILRTWWGEALEAHVETPKPRKRLNSLQSDILLALYKFRFITRELIVSYQGLKSKSYTYDRLKNLVEQEYIGRKYDNFDKINRQPAVYFIKPKGIRALKDQSGLNQALLNAMYKDRRASSGFINHRLTLFKIYTVLRSNYGPALNFYTQSELAQYDYFLRPLPEAYLEVDNTPFMLELLDVSKPTFVFKRRLERHIEFYESGDWDEVSEQYPSLLLVCDTPSHERRIQRTTANLFERAGIEDISAYTTTAKALLAQASPDDTIWSDTFEPEELLSLNQLSANKTA